MAGLITSQILKTTISLKYWNNAPHSIYFLLKPGRKPNTCIKVEQQDGLHGKGQLQSSVFRKSLSDHVITEITSVTHVFRFVQVAHFP